MAKSLTFYLCVFSSVLDRKLVALPAPSWRRPNFYNLHQPESGIWLNTYFYML